MQTTITVFALTFIFTFLPFVSAHGYVRAIGIDGQWYAGNSPGNDQGPSPIRTIANNGPVKGSTNPDIVCGLSAQNAAMVVPANPGSVFSIQWAGGSGGSGGDNWPHEVGPLMTYMASCGSTSCDQFDGTGAKWFKISQLGQKPGGSTWYQGDIANGMSIDMTLPQNLAPGGYLIRHEIISLQGAVSMGGAEFYPMCTQVMIGGSGSGSPSPTVSFPGAYSDSDPGIYVPQIYNGPFNYTFPGGPLANLAATNADTAAAFTGQLTFPSSTAVSAAPAPAPTGGQPAPSSAPSSPAGAGAASSADPAPSATPSAGSAGGSCMLKPPTASSTNQRRHYKRFGRRSVPYSH